MPTTSDIAHDIAIRLIWYMYREAGMGLHTELMAAFAAIIERRVAAAAANAKKEVNHERTG